MKLNKKITDFITLEDGSIGHKAAMTTGALLASALTSVLLVSTAEASTCHCNYHEDRCNYICGPGQGGVHTNWHDNRSGVCPLPC